MTKRRHRRQEVAPLSPRFTRNIILGNSAFGIVQLVLIAILFGLVYQFGEYLDGRGTIRDRERDQQLQILCDLIGSLSADEQERFMQTDSYLSSPCVIDPATGLIDPGRTSPVPASPSSTGAPSTGTAQPTGATRTAPPATGSPSRTGATSTPGAASTTRPAPPTVSPVVPSTPAPVPTPTTTSPPPPAEGDGGGDPGLVPGLDVLLCLPLVGCVNV